MRSSQRVLSFLVLMITCTFSTGFLSGGENPEDAVKAVIASIENNDANAFNERVTIEYWESFFSDYGQNYNDPSYAWLKNIISNADSMKALERLDLDRATLPSAILHTLPKAIGNLIHKGDFANYCRKYKNSTLPFDPNILKKLTYGEQGANEYEGISSAIATMPDGQESVLGLAKIEKKWYIVSNAGNRKASMDKALAAREALQEKMKIIAERKKHHDLYMKVMKPQNDYVAKLFKEEKFYEIAKFFSENSISYKSVNAETAQLDELLREEYIINAIIAGIESTNKSEEDLKAYQKRLQENKLVQLIWNNYDTINASEIVWKNDNTILIKSFYQDRSKSIEDRQVFFKKWLIDDMYDVKRNYEYSIYYKIDDYWRAVAYGYESFDRFNNSPIDLRYYPFDKSVTQILAKEMPIEQYMLGLAKRFEGMYIKAKTQIANEKKWTKEVQDTFTALNKAITENKPEVFEKHMDIASFLRDRGSLEQVATAIVKNQESNADVKDFLEQVKTGKWEKNTPAKNGFKGIKIHDIAELYAQVRSSSGNVLEVRRKDVNSPWKVIKERTGEHRPKDWDVKLAERMKALTAQMKLENSVKDVFFTLEKAKKDKSVTAFEQYIDFPMFLRDRGEVERTARTMADNQDNNDVKLYLNQVKMNKWSNNSLLKSDLSTIRLVEVTPLRAIVKLSNQYILLQRETEKDTWKIIRHGNTLPSLERPIDWYINALARSAVILEERAKEKARKEKTLAEMQKKMRVVNAGIVKAITEKNVEALFLYVDASTSFIKLHDKLNPDVYRRQMHSMLAPMRDVEEKFKQAVIQQKPLKKLGILWDTDAWNKASYRFLDSKETNVLAELPSEEGKYFALFVPFQSSYKLIVAPTKEVELLIAKGNDIAKLWSQSFAKYTLDATRKEILQFVDLVAMKNGTKLATQVNIANLIHWKDTQSKTDGVKAQVHDTLFANDSYDNVRKELAEKVTARGTFLFETVDVTAFEFEISTFHAFKSNIVVIEEFKHNFLFAKKGNTYHLEAVTGKLSTGQRGQFVDNYLAREKLLAEEQKSTLRTVAMQSTSNAALDLLQVSGGGYEIFKSEKGNIQLRVKASVKNTYEKSVKPLRFMMYFADAEGQGWLPWTTKVTAEEVKPNQSEDFEWEFFPSEKEAYLLQQVANGKMYLMVYTAEAEINKKIYKRFGTMVDPQELPNGLWQLDSFSPIKPMPQWTSAPEEVQEKFWQAMKKNKTALTAHSGAINNSIKLSPAAVATEPEPAASEQAVKPIETAKPVEAVKPVTEQVTPKSEVASAAKPVPVASAPAVQPTVPASKKPGKAVIIPITTDSMSLTAFTPDQKPDSNIRVLVQSKSPLIAVRVESMRGVSASWKTKDGKIKAQGVLAVVQDGKTLNAADASFSLDINEPVTLDLVMQDTGAIADAKVPMRVIFFHKDGSRTYSIIQR